MPVFLLFRALYRLVKKYLTPRQQLVLVISVLTFLGIAITAGSILFRQRECWLTKSPNGDFYAVVTCAAWNFYVPRMPGQAGDDSGYITVYTRTGVSCGTAPIDMAYEADEIQWSATTAELKLVADWDLVKHTVKVSD